MSFQEDAQMLLASYMHLRASNTTEIPEYLWPEVAVQVTVVGVEKVEGVQVEGVQERFESLMCGALRALSAVCIQAGQRDVDVDEMLRAALTQLADLDEGGS